MTIVVNNRQRIFYRFEGEKGAFLLLHHGLFGSHRDWVDAGYLEALEEDFRVILMDARGHGRSDHPLEPKAYAPRNMADDVIAIMDELGIHNLHFLGYGFGALVGLELLLAHPERVRIVMMGGGPPFVTDTMQEAWREIAERIRRDGLTPTLAWLHENRRLPYLPRQEEAEGEQSAALALLEALAAHPHPPEEGRMSVNSPVAMFTGENDPYATDVEQARRRIHRARFVSIPGEDHAGLLLEREALLTEIMRLLRSGKRDGAPARSDEDTLRSKESRNGEAQNGEARNGGTRNNGASTAPERSQGDPASQGRSAENAVTTTRTPAEPAREGDDSGGIQAPAGETRTAVEASPGQKATPRQEAGPRPTIPQTARPPEPPPKEEIPTGAAHGPPRGMFIDPPEAHHIDGETPEIADPRAGEPSPPHPDEAPHLDTLSPEALPPEAVAEVEILNFNHRNAVVLKEESLHDGMPESHETSDAPPPGKEP